jgi:hypothetical protein
MQSRFGFIPRPNTGVAHMPSLMARSRSISPTSSASVHSSSSSSLNSQRLIKAANIGKSTPQRSSALPSNGKTPLTSRTRDSSVNKSNIHASTTASRMRSRTPSRNSGSSPSSLSGSSTQTSTTIKADLNVVRDRYKAQTRMNFFTRRTPVSASNGSPMMANAIKSPETMMIINKVGVLEALVH